MSGKPDLPQGYLGAQPKFKEYGLTPMSHSDPTVTLPGNEVEIKIGIKDPIKTTASLINVKDGKEYNEYIFTQSKQSVISFIVSLPTAGWWKLQLYALPQKDESTQLFGVYNYVIDCQRVVKTAYAYPKQYAQWKDNCYITEPMVLHRDVKGPSVRFRVNVPGATAVAVVAGEEWTHLQGSSPGLWEGVVELMKYYGKNSRVTLNANFGADKTSYATLLEYII